MMKELLIFFAGYLMGFFTLALLKGGNK